MTRDIPALPIDPILPEITRTLAEAGRAVLVAPPGSGKTTRVPLALLETITGRIIMLEPRRLAARAAAERLAQSLGEAPGVQVGYRMRGESRSGSRIEVVTEGILTRMIQSDPALEGVGCVIFDEFHERSLNADLGLALLWESRSVLRPDLAVLVMSATLDAAPIAALLDDAPVLRAEGQSYPVETRWLERPLPPRTKFIPEITRLIETAHHETATDPGGTLLAFLPGEGEIRRCAAALSLPDTEIVPLYGALPPEAQRRALTPPPKSGPRRIILATSIAETSLTLPDVRVVVDGGRARRARFDPNTGMSRLVTERVSRAEATQRQGRAGRVAAGLCYRLWARAEEGALPAFAPPEIATADLTGLALELATWGAQGDTLAFLTPPPEGALAEARQLLRGLGALDASGRITPHGRDMAALPTHPRLAHMLIETGPEGADLAAIMAERDLLRDAPADLALRLKALHGAEQPYIVHTPTRETLRREATRLRKMLGGSPRAAVPASIMAARAYPDRIAQRRSGDAPRYLLSSGRGAVLAEGDDLGSYPYLVATDLDGQGAEPRIRMGIALDEADLRQYFAAQIGWHDVVAWSSREGRVQTRMVERLGALVLAERPLRAPDPESVQTALIEALREIGLPWRKAALNLRARAVLAGLGEGLDDAALLADPDWLRPWLGPQRSKADLRALDLLEPLRQLLGHQALAQIERIAPAHFTTPLGRRVAIDYEAETPSVELRLQELFGQKHHPMIGHTPLRLTLLSPGQKPVAITTDLPSFWAGSYADVRKDMRGRYPRHPWPEDPTQADPTLRAKPRG